MEVGQENCGCDLCQHTRKMIAHPLGEAVARQFAFIADRMAEHPEFTPTPEHYQAVLVFAMMAGADLALHMGLDNPPACGSSWSAWSAIHGRAIVTELHNRLGIRRNDGGVE